MLSVWHLGFRNVKKCYVTKFNRQFSIVRTFCSQSSVKVAEGNETFDEFMTNRRLEANRSVVIQVSSEKSFPELYSYCSLFGKILGARHYKILQEDLHYILIEFENEETANEAIASSTYNEDLSGVPVRSPFLWFRAGDKMIQKQEKVPEKYLQIVDGTQSFNNSELDGLLQSAESLEDQIEILHKSTQLNDLGVRLRFLAARQIENSISGMFPNANACPFGSSVNGFGKMGCDLDLILRFDKESKNDNSSMSRLVFHTKENLTNGRSQKQRQMESISDIMQLFLPGICHVRRILQARVPIIKFHHEHLDLEVDLSMNNLTGVYMSEIFYMFGKLDCRVRPLIFTIRKWAQSSGLTNPSPGRWITNFSLTCLIIFFFQQMKNPILPPIDLLVRSATTKDVRLTEDGVNCTFLRDHKDLQFQTKNTSKLSELLLQFFEFYSQFDFHNRAISLNEGRSTSKPDHSAMYIVNPLEQTLNVSKNVSLEECERYRIEVRNAAWVMESEVENVSSLSTENLENSENSWGLLNLFKTPEGSIIRPNLFFKSRMVDVSELFDKSEMKTSFERIDYKNESVRNQVQSIKHRTKSDLKHIRMDAIASGGNTKGRRR